MTHSFVETLPLVLDDPLTTLLRETSHDARLIRWTGTRDQEQDLTLGRCRSHLALPRIDSRQYLPPPPSCYSSRRWGVESREKHCGPACSLGPTLLTSCSLGPTLLTSCSHGTSLGVSCSRLWLFLNIKLCPVGRLLTGSRIPHLCP